MNTPDFIKRAAQLQCAIEDCAAMGRQPPPQLVRELQHIADTAQARLTPAQLQSAMQHFHVAKMQHRQEQDARRGESDGLRVQYEMAKLLRRETAGMLGRKDGVTRDQLAAVAQGKAPPKAQSAAPTPEQIDAEYRQRTRAMDPKGIGWGKKEFERRMDELADASPADFAKLAMNYRAGERELRDATNKWRNERIEYGLMERRKAKDALRGVSNTPADRAPNNDEQRRAAVVESYMKHTADAIESEQREGKDETFRAVFEKSPQWLLEEKDPDGKPTRRAVMAAALDAQDDAELEEASNG